MILKRLFVIVCLLMIVACIGAFVVLTSPRASSRVIGFLVGRSLPNATLKELTIAGQQFVFPERLSFTGVKLKIASGQENYAIGIASLEIGGLEDVFASKVSLPVKAAGVSLEHKDIRFSSAEITGAIALKALKFENWQGTLAIPEIEAYRYKVGNVHSVVSGTVQGITFHGIKADFYEGKIVGNINVDWTKEMRYQSEIKFEAIDLNALREVDDAIYGQIEGVVQGTMSLAGTSKAFDALGFKAQITKNGRLKAALLKFILPYIPRTEDSAKLLDLMKVPGSKVPVEIARMDLQTVDEHKISGLVKLGVGRLNLDLNLPIDILYDGNLLSLIEWVRKLGK